MRKRPPDADPTEATALHDDNDTRNEPHFAEFETARDLLAGPDWRRGLEQLEALAHRGSMSSLLLVAGCMLEGWGYDQDLPGAEAWYRIAADQGNARGHFGLGLAQTRLEQFEDAIGSLDRAISLGYAPAYNALAYVYSQGIDISRDRSRALSLWRTGSSLGHLASHRALVWALLHGYAGPRGRVEGVSKLLRLAGQVARAKLEPIVIGSGDFHRVR